MLLSNKRLDGKQKQQFREALDAAFNYNGLELMLRDSLDLNLEDIVQPNAKVGKSVIVQEVIEKAERESWTALLLHAVLSFRREDDQLITFAQQFGSIIFTPPLKEVVTGSPKFERAVTAAPMHIYDPFLRGLWEHGSRICLIKIAGKHEGTGFLVGPNRVMTCYHVYEKAVSSDNTVPSKELKCIFDVGTPAERSYQLAESYKVSVSENGSEEDELSGKASSSGKLDYALLQLNGTPGDESILRPFQDKPSKRGWIVPASQESHFLPETPLYIIQYPDRSFLGDEQNNSTILTLSLDESAIIQGDKMRVKYKTNTAGGSSGSPCFNSKWELVAMHQMGTSTYNQGISFAAIRKHVEQKHPGIFIPFVPQANLGASGNDSQKSFENTSPVTGAPSQKQTSSRSKQLPRPASSKKPYVSTPPPAKLETAPQKPGEDAVPIDRDALLESLENCSPGIFSKIVFNCKVPKSVFSDGDVSQTQRAIKVIEWAEVRGDKGLTSVLNCYLVAMDINPEKKTPRNPL